MFKRVLRFCLRLMMWFFIISISWVIIYRFIPPPISYLMIERTVGQLFSDKPVKFKKDWVSFDEISMNMKKAAIAAEDQLFLEHMGFDWDAVKKAYTYNQKKKGRVLKGGSTITQQVAKNVFLWPQRSWVRKGFEVYFTFLIEIFWSKKRILHVYLNVIEMGEGIYGIEAASKIYFNKSAANLTRAEAALIAAVLPNPRRWSPAKPTSYIYGRQARIMRGMRQIGDLNF